MRFCFANDYTYFVKEIPVIKMAEIKKTFKSVDGNTAAAMMSYNFTEVAAIYPITPPPRWRRMSMSMPPKA